MVRVHLVPKGLGPEADVRHWLDADVKKSTQGATMVPDFTEEELQALYDLIDEELAGEAPSDGDIAADIADLNNGKG